LFFEDINKINRPLANLTKMRREKPQISKIGNAKRRDKNKHHGNPGNHQRLFENLYSNIFENLEEMDRCLDTYDHSKLNEEDINHLNRCITQNEIEAILHSSPNQTKTPPKRRTIGQSL
jgi:hypothetical protein